MSYLLFVLLVAALLLGLITPTVPAASRSKRLIEMTENGVTVYITGDTHTNTTIDNITPVLNAADVGKGIFGAGIPINTTILTVAAGGASITISNATTATAAGVSIVVFDKTATGVNGRALRLFTGALNPSTASVLSDFTAVEANYNGYAGQALAITYGYVDPSGTPTAQGQLMSFKPTDALVPNAITGWWIDDGTNVLVAARLDAAVALNGPTDELAIVYQEGYPSGPGLLQVIP